MCKSQFCVGIVIAHIYPHLHRKDLASIKPLSKETIKHVEKFVVFVGYPRSGSSITGSLLDAHPNAIIAHEFYLFTKIRDNPELLSSKQNLFNELYVNSYMSNMAGWRNTEANSKGYSLELEGMYQGRFNRTLKIIGDKTAGDAANIFDQHPWLSHMPYYKRLEQAVDIPVYFIHVVRNPFDLVATATNYIHEDRRKASETDKLYDPVRAKISFHSVFRKAAAVRRLKSLKLPVLDVHLVDLVTTPVETMRSVCVFLELDCSDDYLQKCKEKVFGRLSKSRKLIQWPHGLREQVSREKRKYSFFARYAFNTPL